MPIIDPYKSGSKPFDKHGWFCGACGAWVPDGVLHNCMGGKPGPGVQPDALATIINDILRKQKELEDRISLLESAVHELREIK